MNVNNHQMPVPVLVPVHVDEIVHVVPALTDTHEQAAGGGNVGAVGNGHVAADMGLVVGLVDDEIGIPVRDADAGKASAVLHRHGGRHDVPAVPCIAGHGGPGRQLLGLGQVGGSVDIGNNVVRVGLAANRAGAVHVGVARCGNLVSHIAVAARTGIGGVTGLGTGWGGDGGLVAMLVGDKLHGKLVEADLVAVGVLVEHADRILSAETGEGNGDLHSVTAVSAGIFRGGDDTLVVSAHKGKVRIVNSGTAVDPVAELAQVAIEADPAPVGQGIRGDGGQVRNQIPIGGLAGLKDILGTVARVARARIELVEGLVNDDGPVLVPHGNSVHFGIILLGGLIRIEEGNVLDIEVILGLCLVAVVVLVDAEAAVIDDVTGKGGDVCLEQIDDDQVPVLVLVPIHVHDVVLAVPASAVAQEHGAERGNVRAVGNGHVAADLTVNDALGDDEIGIGAVGDHTGKGSGAFAHDLGDLQMHHVPRVTRLRGIIGQDHTADRIDGGVRICNGRLRGRFGGRLGGGIGHNGLPGGLLRGILGGGIGHVGLLGRLLGGFLGRRVGHRIFNCHALA